MTERLNDLPDDQTSNGHGQYMEIAGDTKKRKWLGWIAFILIYLIVSAALVTLFIYFTNNWTLAIMLVGFMVMYMSFMGWLAMRKADERKF